MSLPDPTLFWSRRPAVSACREGDNLILFDPDAGREKVVNGAGAAVWEAMDGTARLDDLAAALARLYEVPPADEKCAPMPARSRTNCGATGSPRRRPRRGRRPLPAEDYSWLREAPRALDLS